MTRPVRAAGDTTLWYNDSDYLGTWNIDRARRRDLKQGDEIRYNEHFVQLPADITWTVEISRARVVNNRCSEGNLFNNRGVLLAICE